MGLSSESIIIVSARGALLPASEITWAHPFLHEVLNRIPVDVKSLIDVGCGRGIMGALLRIYRKPKRLIVIDGFKEYLDFCGETKFYDELYECDLRQTPPRFNDKEFDVATCIEVVEHLPQTEGISLLDELERIAKMVIITTTNGFFP
jgi:2-polyprenyl-3-methyl-5-hydroxy-6-metoxy-1,4-benzoquinol methylase